MSVCGDCLVIAAFRLLLIVLDAAVFVVFM